jgi:hypothetical protein
LLADFVLETDAGHSFRPEKDLKMKTNFVLVLVVALLSLTAAFAQTADAPGTVKVTPSKAATKPDECTGCVAANAASWAVQEAITRPIHGSSESMVVGRIENLIPIGMLAVLGCEKCSTEAVNWALQQGSSGVQYRKAQTACLVVRRSSQQT